MRLLENAQDIIDALELAQLEEEAKEKNRRIKELREYFKAKKEDSENCYLAGSILFSFQERRLEKLNKKALKLEKPDVYQEYTEIDTCTVLTVKKAA